MDNKCPRPLTRHIVETLKNLGWNIISQEEFEALRDKGYILSPILAQHLATQTFANDCRLSEQSIEDICQALSQDKVQHMGLISANEYIYETLCLGINIREQTSQGLMQSCIPLINWQQVHTNQYHIAENISFSDRTGSKRYTIDVLCFINGIPLLAIFSHKTCVDSAIKNALHYQQPDAIPELFAFTQLLFSFDSQRGRFGAPQMPAEHWHLWREENFIVEQDIPGTGLYNSKNAALLEVADAAQGRYYFDLKNSDLKNGDLNNNDKQSQVTQLLTSLGAPLRFLEYLRFFHLYEKQQGKLIAHYHQYFSIKALLEYLTCINHDGQRMGGVVWHSSGADTHHTLLLLTRALLLHPNLKSCRVLVVSDRSDIETHLCNSLLASFIFDSREMATEEGKHIYASTAKELIRKIRNNDSRLILTKLNKFNIAIRQHEQLSDSANIITLIDDMHAVRLNDKHPIIRKALPKAALIAFSSQPLLACEKRENKFGPVVHSYPPSQAIQDRVTVPIYYEQRHALSQEKNALAQMRHLAYSLHTDHAAHIAQALTQQDQNTTKHHIAWDIALHFYQNYKPLNVGLKAKLATNTIGEARQYKKLLDQTGLVSSALVLSPSEKNNSALNEDAFEVQNWWQENIRQKPKSIEKTILENIANEDDPDILIVVNKLLNHFDEPYQAVLYLDKTLKEHQIIQAVSQMNRLHNDKPYGLVIDYRNTLAKLDSTLQAYQALENQTPYEVQDLKGTITHLSHEYKRLPELHNDLYELFALPQNARLSLTHCRQHLAPKFKAQDGGHYDTRQRIREDFYGLVSDFALSLKLALSSQGYFDDPDFNETSLALYKRDLRLFSQVRKLVKKDAGEDLELPTLEKQILQLIDHEQTTPQQTLSEEEHKLLQTQTEELDIKIENTIQYELRSDPYAQKYFNEKLEHCRQDAKLFAHSPEQAYLLFSKLEEKIKCRDIAGTPKELLNNHQAISYFGVFRLNFEEAFLQERLDDFISAAIDIADNFETLLNQCVTQPCQVEKTIVRKLLPIFHGEFENEKTAQLSKQIAEIAFLELQRQQG